MQSAGVNILQCSLLQLNKWYIYLQRAELVCICKASNIPTANRSSCDMLEDLRKSLIDASQYAKVFRNIHGQTGNFTPPPQTKKKTPKNKGLGGYTVFSLSVIS